ncbi:MAG: hypothetical protein SFY80_02500 [Verrucomicrobiota bacterium]|nr:hypothetical protein [Verrucomicrobiota bacterium]
MPPTQSPEPSAPSGVAHLERSTTMIRLLEDCDIRKLFTRDHPEVLRRYWLFTAYSGPCYFVTDEDGNLRDDEDEYIRQFCYPGHAFIDKGKFNLASPYFQMDEWTSLIGFVSSSELAPTIVQFLRGDELGYEKVVSSYPNLELVGFLWVDGWWELFGDISTAWRMVESSLELTWVDTPSSIYLNKDHSRNSYYKSREELTAKIQNKKSNKSQHLTPPSAPRHPA